MEGSTAEAITVALGAPQDMFEPPHVDPLAGRFHTHSGMDRAFELLASMPPKQRRGVRKLVVEMPQPVDAAALATAIDGYTEAKVAELHRQLTVTSRDGFTVLWIGLGLLALCLTLSAAVSSAEFLPAWLRRLFGEGFIIAGWVVLWRPIDLLVYDRAPIRSDIRIYRQLATLPVEVQPA